MIISDLQLIRLMDYASQYAMSLIKTEPLSEDTINYAREIEALVVKIKYQQSDELKTGEVI